MRVGEDTGADAAEEGRTVGRALLGLRPFERKAEDGSDDREPELAAGAAARDAGELCFDADALQELERIAEPVRDPFEHGADERPAVVPELQADEGAARVRVGVRGALALEIGLEEEAFGTGRPRGRLGEELVVRRAPERLAQPLQRAGRREHHAHRVPRSRHGVAEGVQPRLGLRPVRVERREDDARGAEDDRQRAGRVDTDAQRTRGLVAGARDLG